ncbi:hypothetical protein AM500_01845 [Bacillus sp. FJAT-18017]|uniref:hypothetical protein n=1 Tax=Bacillus sp. FJAT-18017 TaxID=1705566 RepID=UPI0006AED71F|nr:hypothetical protein [Bacillus sp. FJAT-18017]ALC88679.1 hypothetical protein AM500_01845 [Bacillus sp. FJAT-18017]
MKKIKTKYIIALLILSAWPLYYLYQHQLGAISFLLLAILFLMLALKELSMERERREREEGGRNNRVG